MEFSSEECWHANILSIDGSHLLGAAAGLVAGCLAYWWLTRPSSSSGKLIASVDLTQQTKELPVGFHRLIFIDY
ncbi:unnamed protein product [Anisakis simplex]|uniref:Zinc transporter ZIP11 n=1 Tax=Anisakis simplex TaxID=6269 RepID=A0A0M3JM43_ANISI|nr:unnamed protein product [Anisakis simplex]